MTTGATTDTGPLAGITVIELAAYLSAPFAAMMLADLGATVVKVEPPRGDPFRRFQGGGAMSPQFANINRNKEGVVADLKTPDGVERVLELVETADIFLANWRPDTGARLGLGDDVLAARNQRLIRCYVSGFGSDGPASSRPAYDSIAQAASGLTWSWTDGEEPTLAANYLADTVTASMTAQSMLAAIIARDRNGVGERVDVAMVDAFAYFNSSAAMAHRVYLDHIDPDEIPNTTPARTIQALDGWLVISAVTRKQIDAAFGAIGRPEQVDELIAEHGVRNLSSPMLDALEVVTQTQTVAHWVREFTARDVPHEPCHTVDQFLASDYVEQAELYSEHDWPDIGRVRQIRHPARFTSWPRLGHRSPPPPSPPRPKR